MPIETMSMRRELRAARSLLGALLLGLAGCGGGGAGGGASGPPAGQALREVGEIYRLATTRAGKPPTGPKGLGGGGSVFPVGSRALAAGEVVLAYGTPLADTGEEPGVGPEGGVLAFEKKCPEAGGLVLMANRSIKPMTAEQFRAAAPAPSGK